MHYCFAHKPGMVADRATPPFHGEDILEAHQRSLVLTSPRVNNWGWCQNQDLVAGMNARSAGLMQTFPGWMHAPELASSLGPANFRFWNGVPQTTLVGI